jgi:hypothetical protein
MRSRTQFRARQVALVVLLAWSSPTLPSEEPGAPCAAQAARTQDSPPRKCCFTNPGYVGTCEVEPAKDESCGQILDYLNNPASQGKNYCGNTPIRGGWRSVACEPKKNHTPTHLVATALRERRLTPR